MLWRQDVDIKRPLREEEEKGKGGMVHTAWLLVLLHGHGTMGLSAPILPGVCFWVWCVEMLAPLVRTDGAEMPG
jgi:hypothetical protein